MCGALLMHGKPVRHYIVEDCWADKLTTKHARISRSRAAATVRVTDLCCGMDGLSVAARETGMRVAAVCGCEPLTFGEDVMKSGITRCVNDLEE